MIVCFGEALIDLFALPLGATVDTAESFVPRLGGAPANVAVLLGRMGVPVRLVGAVGHDAHGDRLARALVAAGVDTAMLVQLPQRTGITFVHVAPDGERSFLFYRHESADFALTVDTMRALAKHPLDGATWLDVNSSALADEPLASATRWLLDEASARGVNVSLDINLRAHIWRDRMAMEGAVRGLVSRAAWVKASEEDLTGMGIAPTLDALATLAPRAVAVLTLAERGAIARVGDQTVTVAAPPAKVVDATGAGDAFAAGVLSVLNRQGVMPGCESWRSAATWREALTWGCALGARAVTAVGATDALQDLADAHTWVQEGGHGDG